MDRRAHTKTCRSERGVGGAKTHQKYSVKCWVLSFESITQNATLRTQHSSKFSVQVRIPFAAGIDAYPCMS